VLTIRREGKRIGLVTTLNVTNRNYRTALNKDLGEYKKTVNEAQYNGYKNGKIEETKATVRLNI
jgi:hypothetical protein